MTKNCKICKLEKDITAFHIHSHYKGKPIYKGNCIECRAKADKAYYQHQKEFSLEKILWHTAKNRAKRKGLPFNLDVADIVIPDVCPIFKMKLVVGIDFAQDCSPSLDRIIPEKGYVKDNCFVISNKANRMKQDNSLEDLLKIVEYIHSHL